MLRAAAGHALKDEAALTGRVDGFLGRVGRFAARRNEIAHGRVLDLGEYGFYLAPNNTMQKKWRKDRAASYQWVAADVAHYADEFAKMAAEAEMLTLSVKRAFASRTSAGR